MYLKRRTVDDKSHTYSRMTKKNLFQIHKIEKKKTKIIIMDFRVYNDRNNNVP